MYEKISVKSFFVLVLRLIIKVFGVLSGLFLVIMTTVSVTSIAARGSEVSSLFFVSIITSATLIGLGSIIIAFSEFRLSDEGYDYEGDGFFEKVKYYFFKKRIGYFMSSLGLTLLLLLTWIATKVFLSWPTAMFLCSLMLTVFCLVEMVFSEYAASEKEYIQRNTIFYASITILTILLWVTKSPLFF